MMEIELGESADNPCSCCGGTTRTIWGYVYSDENARAVYYVRGSMWHPEQGLSLAISIGRWGEGASPAERQTVALEGRLLENGPAFMVVDAASSAWGHQGFLGAMLSRQDALSSPITKEAFSIVDRIIEVDERIKEFVGQQRPSAI
jgi:hypothetical protein